jgi:endonuclease YncB( thermonuclease family)
MKLGYPNSGQKRSIRILSWFFFFLTIAAYHHALAQQQIIEGFVTKVSDGDTIQVITDNKTKLKVRLSGIDCPETPKINQKTGKINKPGQPFSQEAHDFTTDLILGKRVKIIVYGKDKYRRDLGFIFKDDLNINLELVKKGLAEVYRGKGAIKVYRIELEKAEKESRDNHRGIWTLGDNYESPAKFRKRMKIRGG